MGHARLELSGWTDRSGALSLRVVVSAPRERIKIDGLSGPLLDSLTDAEGTSSLSFKVGGSRHHPRVVPDLPEMSGRSRRQLERILKQQLRELLKRRSS